ncbi:hypothetical protein DFH07DRAFT_423986 [Mycena maculata]|uniref:Short-chain dehydrogenase/reductase family protein n=1 Tax=Mycena maculata TaxID=230809 RepID=A0AAD7JB83_9AGAR|nr:hypothetical protein DFH07DRAFT_423986 [Mycena maculata]
MSAPAFSFTTTADDVATVWADEIQGKNVLITGTSLNGLGFEAARVISKHANLVIITGYNVERLKLSEETIRKDVPGANIRRLILDLASLDGVRKAATEVNAYSEPLHVLIHNAAAAVGPFKLTVDNLESQMATAHFGPFLFTKLLAPKLLASATAAYTPRVVFVSSKVHAMGAGVNFDTIAAPPDAEKYDDSDAYAQSKSANILTAIELSRRSKGRINAYSLHPGLIFTNINQTAEAVAKLQAMGIVGPDGLPNDKFHWKTIPQGAATIVAAAFDPRLSGQPGAYLEDSTVATQAVAPHSSDPANSERLWAVTEKIIGEEFAF